MYCIAVLYASNILVITASEHGRVQDTDAWSVNEVHRKQGTNFQTKSTPAGSGS